jgi:hypothetical protein
MPSKLEMELARAQRELGIGEDYDDDETGYVEVGDDWDDDDIEGDYDIGDDDYDDIEGDYDIGDDDYEDDVGRRRRRRRPKRRAKGRRRRPRSKKVGQSKIRVPGLDKRGDSRIWALPCTAVASMAAAAAGTLTFTPNRNVSIVGVTLDVYVAAAITTVAMFAAAIQITNITVAGRSQFPGAGVIPLSAFQPIAAQRWTPVQWENCPYSQSVVITLTNADAATTHIAVGCLWVITVA